MAVAPPRAGSPGQPRNRHRDGSGGRFGQFVLVSAISGAVLAGMGVPMVAAAGFAARNTAEQFESLPATLQTPPLPQRTYMEAADGTRIATLFQENRVEVPLAKISPYMQQAVIAIEDSRFYQHHGVDVRGAFRALVNSATGYQTQGGSTLTMQYVKNLLITNARTPADQAAARARTISRKIQEMRYALALETQKSKDEILAGYLNISYYGAGAYGVEAAARRYFNTSAMNLTLTEAATLAGIVQQPGGFDPLKHPQASAERRNTVLARMATLGYISQAEAATAAAEPMKDLLDPQEIPNGCTASKFPFYCDFVLHQIRNDRRYGATAQDRDALLRRGGLVIRTALDLNAMRAAQNAVNRVPPKDPSKKAAAIAMVEPVSGAVQALAQDRSWGTKGRGKTTYNYAVDAKDGGTIGMQAGSTFKIFTLTAAMEAGISPQKYIYAPEQRTFSSGDWGCKGNYYDYYPVRNSTSSGTFNMWQGTAYSVNTYFVELQRQAGLCRTVDVADRMGVTLANGDELLRVPSFTLGTMEVSPLALASAYATIANHGIYCRPHAVTRISDLTGTRLYSDDGACRRVVSRDAADAVTALLSGVVDGDIAGRTGQDMSLGRDAAGKTGTTDSSAAVWFAGFTPDLAAAVWVGDPRGGFKYPMKNVTIDGEYYDQVFGSTLPGPIWRSAMAGALSDTPETSFDLESKYGLTSARSGGVGGGYYYDDGDSSYETPKPKPDPGSSTDPLGVNGNDSNGGSSGGHKPNGGSSGGGNSGGSNSGGGNSGGFDWFTYDPPGRR